MVSGSGIISQNRGLSARIQHDDIHVAVAVQVIHRSPATAEFYLQTIARLGGNVDELALAVVAQQTFLRRVGSRGIKQLDVIVQMTAGDKDVSMTVVVEVGQSAAPGHVAQRSPHRHRSGV